MSVPFTPEDVLAVEAALRRLEDDERTLDYWGAHSVELTILVEDIRSLSQHMRAEQEKVRESTMHKWFPKLEAV
jgi:hypothetical protein